MSSTIYNPKMNAVNERFVLPPSESGSDEDGSDKLGGDQAKFYMMVRQGQQLFEDLADLFSSVVTIQSDTEGKGDQSGDIDDDEDDEDDEDDANTNTNISTPHGSGPSYAIQNVQPPEYVNVMATKKGTIGVLTMCSILFAAAYTNTVFLACFPAVPTGKEGTAETAPCASRKRLAGMPSSGTEGKRLKFCPAQLVPIGKVPPAWLGVVSDPFPKNLLRGSNTLEPSKQHEAASPLQQLGGETGEKNEERTSKTTAVPVNDSPGDSECTHPSLAQSSLVYFPSAHPHAPLMFIVALLFHGVQRSFWRQNLWTRDNCSSSSPTLARNLRWLRCKIYFTYIRSFSLHAIYWKYIQALIPYSELHIKCYGYIRQVLRLH